MTEADLKELLHNPLVLLAAMYLATIVSALKQISSARMDGIRPPTCVQYFVKYWYETLAVLLGNLLSFAVLVETDTLNFASAIGIGYAVNSMADMLRRGGGRSAAIAGVKKEGE